MRQTLLFFSVFLTLSCGPTAQRPLESFVGQTVDVQFCAGLWECCLPPEFENVDVKSVEGEKICFVDASKKFIPEYSKILTQNYPDWQVVSEDTFCVNSGDVSWLKQNGKPVWGDGSALCKGWRK